MTEQEQRQRVIDEALTWLGTPYHLNAKKKGVGVDCGTLLIASFAGAGLIDDVTPGVFHNQFHLHRGDEVYIQQLQKYCRQVTEPQPGDIVLYRFGRLYAHGALVIDWPRIIHAQSDCGVVLADATDDTLAHRQGPIWSFWGK